MENKSFYFEKLIFRQTNAFFFFIYHYDELCISEIWLSFLLIENIFDYSSDILHQLKAEKEF